MRKALLLALGATAFASSASGAAPAPSCFPEGSKTLAASKTARVFETRRGTYGCLFKYGRARRLDPNSESRELETVAAKPYRLAGPYVAYVREASQVCAPDNCDWTEVVVADLRPAKPLILHKHYAATDEGLEQYNEDVSSTGVDFVTDLVLRPTGAIAWIVCDGTGDEGCHRGPSSKRLTSVFSASPARRARTKLDEGAGIELRSLTWADGKFRWRNGGGSRSAPA